MASRPTINPETVDALLDATWRLVSAEDARTESLDRKAATLATFASLVLSLVAGLGTREDSAEDLWAAVLFALSLTALVASALLSVRVLLPKEHITLGMAYVERFPKWSEIRKPPEQVRGETMSGLIEAMARERAINRDKARLVRRGFVLLVTGLILVAAQASILGVREVQF